MKKVRKFKCVILSLVLVFSICFGLEMPDSRAASAGTCGDNLTWELDDDGTLTISGDGYFEDYSDFTEVPWYSVRKEIVNVIIDGFIYNIGNFVFYDCSNLKKISFDDDLLYIGESSFYGCNNLTSIQIPDSVNTIYDSAFAYCTKLKSIVLGKNIVDIWDGAFDGCSSLETVYYNGSSIDKENINIGANNDFLTNTTWSYTETANGFCGENLIWELNNDGTLIISGTGDMYDYSYSSKAPWYPLADDIKKVEIKDGTISIGNMAFKDCSNCISIDIPSSISRIGEDAFNGCTGLTSIIIPESVTTIGESAFIYCENLQTIELPEGLTSIENELFWECRNLTSIRIPSSVTSIGERVFYECNILKEIIIPDGVISIGDSAFSNCGGLTNITIPASVTNIGSEAFFICSNLAKIEVNDANKNYSSKDGVLFSKNKDILYVCPCKKEGVYTIPTSVVTLSNDGFFGCEALTEIIIPDSVTTIEYGAFGSCTNITHMVIPDSVTSLGSGALSNCSSLESIELGSRIPVIKDEVFAGCNSLQTVLLPDSVTSIGLSAFYNCSSLQSITIPDKVTFIASWAFSECEKLSSVILGKSVEKIHACSFQKCYSLTSITIPDSVTDLDLESFDECINLLKINISNNNSIYSSLDGVVYSKDKTELLLCPEGRTGSFTIPDNVTSIGRLSFSSCKNLTSIEIPDTVTSIGDNAFSSCSKLSNVVIGANVKNIERHTFSYCTSLKSIDIPDSVESIDEEAFYECHNLESITLGKGIKSIEYGCFWDCSSLKDVYYRGTKEDRANIIIDEEDNEALLNAEWHYIGESKPEIKGNPSDISVAVGKTAAFSITASNVDSYQWYYSKNDGNTWVKWTSKTSDSFNVIGSTTNNGCLYKCQVSNSSGSVESTAARLTVTGVKPRIMTNPSDVTIEVGKTVEFKVAAGGSELSYQWYYSKSDGRIWTKWTTKTAASFKLAGSETNNGALYKCRISNSYGYVESKAVRLTVTGVKPRIMTNPSDVTIEIGKTVEFKVAAGGSDLSYQWYYSKNDGATWTKWTTKKAASFTLAGSETNNGALYKCRVTNDVGYVESKAARITVTGAKPRILTQPADAEAELGQAAEFKVAAGGSNLTYQWYYSKNNGVSWTKWTSKKSASFSVTASTTNNGCLYKCRVSNSVGYVESKAAKLTVNGL